MIRQNKGFTIIELLIATTVFSVILLIMTAGLLHIGKVYYRSVAQAKAQEASRSIIEAVAKTIQFSSDIPITPPTSPANIYCVGDIIFIAHPHVQVPNADSGLIRAKYSGACDGSNLVNEEQLVPEGMFLDEFSVTPVDPTSLPNVFAVNIRVVSVPQGETIGAGGVVQYLFNGTNCETGPGTEFCATSKLSTTVTKRL